MSWKEVALGSFLILFIILEDVGVNREFNLDWIKTAVSFNSFEINLCVCAIFDWRYKHNCNINKYMSITKSWWIFLQVLWHGVHSHQRGQKQTFYRKWWEKTRIESHGVVCVSRSSVDFLHIWKSWRVSSNQETQSHVRTGSAAMSVIYRDTLQIKWILIKMNFQYLTSEG
mgnify:CR=1 FL=1